MELKQLELEHFYALRDLLDGVFSRSYGRETRFSVLFPRLFSEPNAYCTSSHWGAFDGPRLIGTAAMYPMEYVVGGVTVRLIANGNVAVHEEYRGQGVMSRLLGKINEECDRCGDAGYLHGKVERYARFGYVPGGIQYLCRVDSAQVEGYEFVPMRLEEVPKNQAIYQSRPDYLIRKREDFLPALRSQGREPLSVYRKGNLAGYVSLDRGKSAVEEYALADEAEVEVFQALAAMLGTPVIVRLSGYETAALSRLKDHASVTVSEPAQFRIIRREALQTGARALGLEESVYYAPYLT